MMEHENAIKIAKIEQQIDGMREQQKAHHQDTKDDIKDLDAKVDELIALMNRGKGAYAVSMVVAGSFGAMMAAVIEGLATYFHK